MFESHPEYRLAAVLTAVVLVAGFGLSLALLAHRGEGAPRQPAAESTAIPAPPPTSTTAPGPATAAPTSDPALATALLVGEEFALAYVDYDYRQGPPTGDPIKPFATQRLCWQVTQGGQDTAGNPAPWTAITLGSDEVVIATVVSAEGQVADGDAAVQVVLDEHDITTGGSWEGRSQEDLGLALQGDRWLVDQVTQVAAGSGV